MSLYETYYVPRIMETLELLARGPRRPGELAEHLAVHQRTARRILARLADEGYVFRPKVMSPYSLTPQFADLAARALRSTPDAPGPASAEDPATDALPTDSVR
jgi:DNA-binding IclR family transcriptional regulator